MQVKNIMTKDPACCTKDTSLTDVARMMVDCDCGAVPVVESDKSGKPVGIITDRDIVCRTLADGKDPFQMAAGDCMSIAVVTVRPDTGVEECADLMADNKIRRVLVVDEAGNCCGIVSQADLAKHADQEDAADLVREVSEPTEAASAVGAR